MGGVSCWKRSRARLRSCRNGPGGRLAAQDAVEPDEGALVHRFQLLPGLFQGLGEEALVLRRATQGMGIGAVDREGDEQLEQRAPDRTQRNVAAGQLEAGDLPELQGEAFDVAGEQRVQHALARLADFLGEAVLAAAEFQPQMAKHRLAARFVLQQRKLIHEVIAGVAPDLPVRWEGLAGGEDLLHEDRRAVGGAPQAPAIAARVGEAIHVVDAQAIDQPFGHQFQQVGVAGLEDVGAFGAQADQFVDVEEAPPVDVVRRHAPVGQAIVLLFDEPVQAVPVGAVGGQQALQPATVGQRDRGLAA